MRLDTVVIRFAGDSGDGIQVTGQQMAESSAILGNDIHTFPDFPAEIRAPAGTLAGISGFQLCFSAKPTYTPGDKLNTLIAFNPAALQKNLVDLLPGGLLVLDTDKWTEIDLSKAGYTHNPLDDETLLPYKILSVPLTQLTMKAVEPFKLAHSKAKKCKNMFALGMIYWLYDHTLTRTLTWIADKFAAHPNVLAANQAALRAGYAYAETTELLSEQYQVPKAPLEKGTYRHITGNKALAMGALVAASQSPHGLLAAGYPITPASDILLELAKYPEHGVHTFQAEDEVAAACAAVGASFGGALALTATSGPGFDLKSESIGLAVMAELPLVVVNVQRAGPSTGMPTKGEQSDLLSALYGRHGECPVPVLAASRPSDCFDCILECFQIALDFMTPVILLSDAFLANAAEPWRLPEIDALPKLQFDFAVEVDSDTQVHCSDTHPDAKIASPFAPYTRDPKTGRRPWAIPGTPGLMHRLGGLEKEAGTGEVSYDPENHEKMVQERAHKIEQIAQRLPTPNVSGVASGPLLLLSWGATYGVVHTVFEALSKAGHPIAALHLRHLNPFPPKLEAILKRYNTVLLPEHNLGQLAHQVRATFEGVQVRSLSKVQGKPFTVSEIKTAALEYLGAHANQTHQTNQTKHSQRQVNDG